MAINSLVCGKINFRIDWVSYTRINGASVMNSNSCGDRLGGQFNPATDHYDRRDDMSIVLMFYGNRRDPLSEIVFR